MVIGSYDPKPENILCSGIHEVIISEVFFTSDILNSSLFQPTFQNNFGYIGGDCYNISLYDIKTLDLYKACQLIVNPGKYINPVDILGKSLKIKIENTEFNSNSLSFVSVILE